MFLADISDQWVLLKKEGDLQLVFLRDSLNRVPPTPTPEPVSPEIAQIPGMEAELATQVPQLPEIPTEVINNIAPPSLQALNAFSEIFFAMPLY